MTINRGLLVYGFVMAGLVALAIQFKPSAEDVRRDVHRAIAVRAATDRGDVEGIGDAASGDVTGLAITDIETRDWVLARSHVSEFEGERFSCVAGVGFVICDTPEK